MYIADVCHPLLSDNLSFQRLTHIHTTVYLCDTQVRSLVASPEKTVGSLILRSTQDGSSVASTARCNLFSLSCW